MSQSKHICRLCDQDTKGSKSTRQRVYCQPYNTYFHADCLGEDGVRVQWEIVDLESAVTDPEQVKKLTRVLQARREFVRGPVSNNVNYSI